jgi:hypothetical protein
MITARRFSPEGITRFEAWLATASPGGNATALAADSSLSDEIDEVAVDESRLFRSRYEFGVYLCGVLSAVDREELLSVAYDGLWAWLNALYFQQLAPRKIRRAEHYICMRRGSAGYLLHRNAARTAFELVAIHGKNAEFALQQPMHTHGQLLESLSASQSIARNCGFFAAAARMYLDVDGKIKKGATSKPKKPKDRKPGDVSGKGSIRRLPVALRRLDLTYDVDALTPDELVSLLPREYERWTTTPQVARP